jgi:hypothetical protein
MEPNLGMNGVATNDVVFNILRMDLESDLEGFIYFNELLFKTMKRVYGEKRIKNKVLAEHELKTVQKIQRIKDKMIKKSRNLERKAVAVNPFLTIMYRGMAFRTWHKIMVAYLGRRN